MKKSIYFNSADRQSGTSSNFILKYDLRQFYKCERYYISSLIMPFSYYVVNSNNNVLLFLHPTVGGGSTTITITAGNYTPSELVTTIQTALDAISAGLWTISYNTKTGKFSFSTGATSFGFNATSSSSILHNLMGFDQTTYTASTSTKTSTNVADLSGPKYIYLKSNALAFKSQHEPISSNSQLQNIILGIPVEVNAFDTIVYKNYNDSSNPNPYERQFPNIIDIQLVDESNVPIDLNGCDFQFEITAFFSDLFF
jgi:hypothetical protein